MGRELSLKGHLQITKERKKCLVVICLLLSWLMHVFIINVYADIINNGLFLVSRRVSLQQFYYLRNKPALTWMWQEQKTWHDYLGSHNRLNPGCLVSLLAYQAVPKLMNYAIVSHKLTQWPGSLSMLNHKLPNSMLAFSGKCNAMGQIRWKSMEVCHL